MFIILHYHLKIDKTKCDSIVKISVNFHIIDKFVEFIFTLSIMITHRK